VAVPFTGTGHTVHDGPQACGVWVTHWSPQWLNPALQAIPQVVPSQVATPFAGGGAHGMHEPPQLCGDVFDAHAVPQAW
jgi:hypothetical protein